MMIYEAASHFSHIKVTVGDVRGGVGLCAKLPLENTGLFGFYVCIRRLEFPSAQQRRFLKQHPAREAMKSGTVWTGQATDPSVQ